MVEQEPSQEICSHCGQQKTVHTPETCSLAAEESEYRQKLQETNDAEGITPEFEEAVKAGKITFDQQMREINEKLGKLFGSDSEEHLMTREVSSKSREARVKESIEKLQKLSDSNPEKNLQVDEIPPLDSETIEAILVQASDVVQITSNYFIELYKIESEFKDERKAEYERLKSNYLEYTQLMQKYWKNVTEERIGEKTNGKVFDQINTVKNNLLQLQEEIAAFVRLWLGEVNV